MTSGSGRRYRELSVKISCGICGLVVASVVKVSDRAVCVRRLSKTIDRSFFWIQRNAGSF